MGLAYDLKLERRARARLAAGQEPVHIPSSAQLMGPTEVIAIKRITIDRNRYEPGQAFTVGGLLLRELLDRREVWMPQSADWWNPAGRVLLAEPGIPAPCAIAPSPGSLRIVQGCAYDPGNAVYRYHSAINEHTKHAAAFIRFGGANPFACPIHIDGLADRETARRLVYEADVVHHHVDYYLGDAGLGPKPRREQLVIRHYHGSLPGGREKQHPIINQIKDDLLGAVLLGARLTLCALRPDRIHWLPIPVPVGRYAALRQPERKPGPFRIAHSPTKAEYKGTQAFLEVCDRLNKRGVKVEPVLIGMRQRRGKLEPDRRTHAEALRMKATCDAVFDSFWLGIQGSGLEGAAMGLPVIAGDPDVAQLYEQTVGHVPYEFANDAGVLEKTIELLATEPQYRDEAAQRVNAYVRKFHDYPEVAKRYEGILAKHLGDAVRTV